MSARMSIPKLPFQALFSRSYVPHTKYKTPPNPKMHPEIHPKSPSKTEIQKKYEKNTKLGDFRIFSYFFCISVLEGDLGCISGCILGFGGVLYFVWGTYDRSSVFDPD